MFAAGICLLAPALPQASAQFYSPYASPPRVSPYLNLYRVGGSTASNYYNLVRPDIEYRTAIQQLGQQAYSNQQAITAAQNQMALPPTGVAAGFQNHYGYFNNLGRQGGDLGLAGGVVQPGGGTPGGAAFGQVPGGATAGGAVGGAPPPRR
jgi:hypothetical protein